MAKTFSSSSEQIFIQELRYQLIAKIATDWENEWAKAHGETFSTIKELPSENAFYFDLRSKIWKFLDNEGIKLSASEFPTEHTFRRFLDETYTKGFTIQLTLNPIAQYCGYENWENFKTLNTEPEQTYGGVTIIPRGGGINPLPPIFVIVPQKPKHWKRNLSIVLAVMGLLSGVYYYFYKYLPFRTLTAQENNDFQITLDHVESDQGRNPYKVFYKYDFSKLRLDSLQVDFGGEKGVMEHSIITLREPKGQFVFDYYKAGVHEIQVKHLKQILKSLPVYVKSHGWSCWYYYATPGSQWVNTNYKYRDFYTDGYLHLPREKIAPSHRENYNIVASRAEDFAVAMDSCTIEFKQKNSPDEEGISFYTMSLAIKNQLGKSISLSFNRNTGKPFIPNRPAVVSEESNEQFYRQAFSIPMICYDWTTVKLIIKHNKAQLWINGKLSTTSAIKPLGGQLKDIHLESKGSGKWDDFRVSNSYTGKVVFEDNFSVIPVSKDGY
ncbi:MAG: hypothetical protein U5N85_09830 [Arcicella sp.]|nr:hypothetical protein [Arcicella sp.]